MCYLQITVFISFVKMSDKLEYERDQEEMGRLKIKFLP